MEESQHFLLEDKLNGLYECLDSVQREFLELKRRSRSTKRTRPVHNHRDIFEKNIDELRARWHSNLSGICNMLSDLSMYDKIINDILRGIQSAKLRYKIDDEDYGKVIKSIVECVVAMIMDDRRMTKEITNIHSRRQYILDKLLTVDLGLENSVDEDDGEIDIDVESIPPTQNGTQIPTSTTYDHSDNNHTQLSCTRGISCKLDSIHVLDVLFDALTRHTSVITRNGSSDLALHIYHVVNITYIVDCVQNFLKTLRERIQAARNSSQAPLDTDILAQLRVAMERYDKETTDNLEKLGLDNPLVIFKRDLRKISFSLRLIQPWLK